MTDTHPITPPPELVKRWTNNAHLSQPNMGGICHEVATQAARWGADAELEACVEWMRGSLTPFMPDQAADQLRAARRPKPPSLAEQALAVVENSAICDHIRPEHETTLRAALERLQELENTND